jgi:hypothetical protein
MGFGMIVLYKHHVSADEPVEFSLIKAFIKITPVILVDSRDENFDVSYSSINQFHNLGTNTQGMLEEASGTSCFNL